MQRNVLRTAQLVLLLATALFLHRAPAKADCLVLASSPVAVDDYAKWPGDAFVVDVVGNDYDPDGDPFAITGFSADRGWLKQEANQIERGTRKNMRNPPGKDLAHERGREAAKGYDYRHSNLQDRDLHRQQHKYDDYGRKNKERRPGKL